MTTETARNAEDDGKPHLSHCCAEHGCKYYLSECPVEKREVIQMYLCEECPSLLEAEQEILDAIMMRDHVRRVLDHNGK